MLTVGEILKKEREKKNISLVDIEKQIRVREKFLKAIEENNWSDFSSKIYIAGIIKNYARLLKLDETSLLAFFRRDYERLEEVSFKKRISSRYLTPEKKRYLAAALGVISLLFVLYFGYQLKLYFSPPRLEILSPTEYRFKKLSRVKIIGKTEKEATISVFGERVYQNKEGIFEYEFPLKQGRNELVIEVIGANGRHTTETREIFVNP